MLKIGIVGFGFMGRMHFRCWRAVPGARVAAVCDPWQRPAAHAAGGNIAGAEAAPDLTGVACCADLGTMLRTQRLDAVSICTPTDLHPAQTVQCLQAGVHVLCEKPMALSAAACRPMLAAARRARRVLQVGQCIRFWPEYALARRLVCSGRFGRVLAAAFQRFSAPPGWSRRGWILQPARSGDAALDFHIHDTDYVQHLCGPPKAVFSRCARGPFSPYDHIATAYLYPRRLAVTAEGGWALAPGCGFRMAFQIVLERATLSYDSTRQPTFRLDPWRGAARTPRLPPGDGYLQEIRHFADLVRGRRRPAITTPEESCHAVRLVEAEKLSADTGRVVAVPSAWRGRP